ncbi:MAG: sulfotransferase domain-containing protein [Alphaproteobacteria bacterium]|nr:sulfotransferase domain-containing protein [Alphaproteobacteria bacterium]
MDETFERDDALVHDTLKKLAEGYFRVGDVDQAIEHAKWAISRSPDHDLALALVAWLISRGRFEEALAHASDTPIPEIVRGLLMTALEPDGAADVLRRAESRHGPSVETRCALALLAIREDSNAATEALAGDLLSIDLKRAAGVDLYPGGVSILATTMRRIFETVTARGGKGFEALAREAILLRPDELDLWSLTRSERPAGENVPNVILNHKTSNGGSALFPVLADVLGAFGYRVVPMTDRPVDLERMYGTEAPLLMWSHLAHRDLLVTLLHAKRRPTLVVNLIRDPRDIIHSEMRRIIHENANVVMSPVVAYVCERIHHLLNQIQAQSLSNAVHVKIEDFRLDPAREVGRILGALAVSGAEATMTRAIADFSFDACVGRYKALYGDRPMWRTGMMWRQGKTGAWRETPIEEWVQAAPMLQPLLKALGYERDASWLEPS